MKRYITAVLIPCLLMQLLGCYSWRIVETPALDTHIKIFVKSHQIIEPKKWRYENENLIIEAGEEKLEGYTAVKVETIIERKKIIKIEEEYLNILNTSILIGGVILVGFLILFISDLDEAGEEMAKGVGELMGSLPY